jgi:hypothetical protein
VEKPITSISCCARVASGHPERYSDHSPRPEYLDA